jgi:hypothetical protein
LRLSLSYFPGAVNLCTTFEVGQPASDDLDKNKERFVSTDLNYQFIDLDDARSKGIMPLPFTAAP